MCRCHHLYHLEIWVFGKFYVYVSETHTYTQIHIGHFKLLIDKGEIPKAARQRDEPEEVKRKQITRSFIPYINNLTFFPPDDKEKPLKDFK